MLQTDIKIALRNLLKYKFFSSLNVLGLALSMSASLVVITVIRNQFGFDKFHPAPERTYRINTEAIRKEGGTEHYASSPFPVGEVLRRDYAVAEEVTALSRGPAGDAIVQGRTLPIQSFYADPAFFRVFGLPLAVGNAATVLAEPFSIVLTQEAATKFFGNENPIDQTIHIPAFGQFKVTGVLQKITQKTHLQFESLVSASTIPTVEKRLAPDEREYAVLDNWTNYYATYNYALLRTGKTQQNLETALQELSANRYQNLTLESRDAGYRFYAQALTNMSPQPELLSNGMGSSLPMFLIWGLMAFVVLLTIFPCLNYANLSIARALVRAKEVGIRKVMGAKRKELLRQFLTEAMLTAGIALVLAYMLRFPLFAILKNVAPDTDSDLYNPFAADWKTYAAYVGFAMAVGLGAGWLPAFYLSNLRPDAALRNITKIRLFSRLTLRKSMIVLQFTISLIFIIVVAAMWQQLNFTTQANYGFNKENIVNVSLQGADYHSLATEIARDHRVVGVSASSHTVGTWEDLSVDLRKTRDSEPVLLRDFFVDQQYLANHDLQLLAGQNFPADANPKRQQYVILNEKALETFALGQPQEAAGKTLWLNDSTELTVQGVVKNYHFRPLTNAIGPLALLYSPQQFTQLNVRLTAGDPAGALVVMEGIWKKMDPVHPLKYTFLDQKIRDCYAEVRTTTALLGFFGLLAISIACLGLLGIVTFTVETRAKEIGVRKVIGASVKDLAVLLSRNYLILLGVAIFIALPIGYLLANMMLEMFAYRISIGVGLLGGSAAALLLFGLLTVGWQTMRAALVNPVESLRRE